MGIPTFARFFIQHPIMKRTLILLSVLALAAASGIPVPAQNKESIALSEKEIIKKGWNFGPLPVVGFDSDLGFQYGLCCDIFNFGDGSNYPSYDYKLNVEASRYTKGSSILRTYGDFKNLIPDGKLFFDCTYFNAQKFDFYGFNGYHSPFTPGYMQYFREDGEKNEVSVFNKMHRSQFRFVTSMQKQIVGHLNWGAGVAYYNIRTGRINLEGYDNQMTLYDIYSKSSPKLIRDNEAEGGNVTQVKVGLIYDSRNHDSDPTRGLNIEATLVAAPDVIDREGYSHAGFTFVGSHYVPVVGDKLTLAYRLGAQFKLWGEIPYYFTNNINTLFFRKLYTEGLGGNASVRGINRNGVLGNGFAWLNTELRWRIFNFRLINQNWGIAINPFFDAGQIVQPYRLEEHQRLGGAYYSDNPETLHCTAGCGLKLVMNHNMVVSFEAAKPFNKNDGDGLWTNIGFNYLF